VRDEGDFVSTEQDNGRVPVPVERVAAQEVPAHGYYYPYPSYPSYPAGDAGLDETVESLDWQRLLGLLWSRKWWILGITTVATVAAFFVTRAVVEPVYEAKSTIWLDESARRGGAITSEDVLEGEGWVDLMRSYAVVAPVVMAERLYVEPKAPSQANRGWFADIEVGEDVVPGEYTVHVQDGGYRLTRDGTGLVETGRMGSLIGNSSGFRWQPDLSLLKGVEEVRFELLSPRLAALGLRSSLLAGFNKEASLIKVSIYWNDAQESATILNGVVDNLMSTAFDLKTRKQAEIVNILEQQTEYAAEQLRERELALESYRIETATEPIDLRALPIAGAEQTRQPVFDAYFEQRLQARRIQTDIDQLRTLLADRSSSTGINELALQQVPSIYMDPDLQTALEELNDKEATRRALLYTYTAQHPEVEEITNEIQELRRNVLPTMVGTLIVELNDRTALLQQELTAQAGELRQIPSRAIEDTRRQREFVLTEDLHNKLLTSLREAKLAAATSLPELQIVDRAYPPFGPISNEAPRMILMVAMASLGLATGGVLLLDRLDRRIYTPEQITRRLGLPVLGIVPRLDANGKNDANRAAVAIESFRSIRTQLSHSAELEPRVVLITSAAPRDGKSMVAANLAISYASAGRRTILVDADTRRGKAERMFELSTSPGLADYLLDRAELQDTEQPTEIEHLTLMARGDHTDFSAELLNSDRMRELIEELAERYENVVLDAPPLAAGADALLLGESADKVVMVVRAGETDEGLALAKLGTIGNVNLPFAGAVLNAVPEKAHYYEYYASHYYTDVA
jgi:capsular exopolysaccharide synthesis family protein